MANIERGLKRAVFAISIIISVGVPLLAFLLEGPYKETETVTTKYTIKELKKELHQLGNRLKVYDVDPDTFDNSTQLEPWQEIETFHILPKFIKIKTALKNNPSATIIYLNESRTEILYFKTFAVLLLISLSCFIPIWLIFYVVRWIVKGFSNNNS